jgi:hypothetical protein
MIRYETWRTKKYVSWPSGARFDGANGANGGQGHGLGHGYIRRSERGVHGRGMLQKLVLRARPAILSGVEAVCEAAWKVMQQQCQEAQEATGLAAWTWNEVVECGQCGCEATRLR